MFTVLAAGTDLVSAHRDAVRKAGVQIGVPYSHRGKTFRS
jgi:hypothetical protein